jgi:hypothetical protein
MHPPVTEHEGTRVNVSPGTWRVNPAGAQVEMYVLGEYTDSGFWSPSGPGRSLVSVATLRLRIVTGSESDGRQPGRGHSRVIPQDMTRETEEDQPDGIADLSSKNGTAHHGMDDREPTSNP